MLLITGDQKRYLFRLRPGHRLHTHLGIFDHDVMLDQLWGGEVASRLGHAALVLEPSVADLIRHIRRGTQIIYPKDAAYLVHKLNLRAGSRVVEAGTGSGGLTIALAWAVAPAGVVYSYETRPDIHLLAQQNLERMGLLPYVQLFQASIDDGFRQTGVDALFLDVREPWQHLPHVRATLRPGGFFASLMPTTNQVSDLVAGLEGHGFADIAVEELLLRSYKPVPDRLRPEDSMVAHTGYLVSARCLLAADGADRWLSMERKRYRARRQFEDDLAAEEARRGDSQQPDQRKYPRMPLPG